MNYDFMNINALYFVIFRKHNSLQFFMSIVEGRDQNLVSYPTQEFKVCYLDNFKQVTTFVLSEKSLFTVKVSLSKSLNNPHY